MLACAPAGCRRQAPDDDFGPGATAARQDAATRKTSTGEFFRNGGSSRTQREPDAAAKDAKSAPQVRATPPLGWLPKDTVAVVRIPLRGQGRTLLDGMALAHALASLEGGGLGSIAATLVDSLANEVRSKVPEGARICDILGSLEGDAVLALVSVDLARTTRKARGMPAVLALHLELRAQESAVLELLRDLVKSSEGEFSEPEPGRFRVADRIVGLDVLVADGWLSASLGPPSLGFDRPSQWRRLPAERSFATSAVAGAGARPEGDPVFDIAFNLAPLWPFVYRSAPPQSRAVLDHLGIDGISGVTLASSLREGLFHDRVRLVAPDHGDVVSALFGGTAPDAAWARHVFPGADTAWIASLDLAAVMRRFAAAAVSSGQGVTRRSGAAPGNASALPGGEAALPFGRHLVFSSRGDLFAAILGGGSFDAALAVEVRDPRGAEALIGSVLQRFKLSARRKTVTIAGQRATVVPVEGAPEWLEPSYALVDGVLIVATSPAALEKALEGGTDERLARGLREALAAHGPSTRIVGLQTAGSRVRSLWEMAVPLCAKLGEIPGEEFAALREAVEALSLPDPDAVAEAVASLPDEVTVVHRADDGIRLDGRGVLPNPLVVVTPIAVTAAVAIPYLLDARRDANEAAAARGR